MTWLMKSYLPHCDRFSASTQLESLGSLMQGRATSSLDSDASSPSLVARFSVLALSPLFPSTAAGNGRARLAALATSYGQRRIERFKLATSQPRDPSNKYSWFCATKIWGSRAWAHDIFSSYICPSAKRLKFSAKRKSYRPRGQYQPWASLRQPGRVWRDPEKHAVSEPLKSKSWL